MRVSSLPVTPHHVGSVPIAIVLVGLPRFDGREDGPKEPNQDEATPNHIRQGEEAQRDAEHTHATARASVLRRHVLSHVAEVIIHRVRMPACSRHHGAIFGLTRATEATDGPIANTIVPGARQAAQAHDDRILMMATTALNDRIEISMPVSPPTDASS